MLYFICTAGDIFCLGEILVELLRIAGKVPFGNINWWVFSIAVAYIFDDVFFEDSERGYFDFERFPFRKRIAILAASFACAFFVRYVF